MSGRATIHGGIQAHNERPAAVWSAGGRDYDQISRGIADAIEHCVVRLNPQPGERILDLATGTGWTSGSVARRGATVDGRRHRGRFARRRPCQSGGRSAADRVSARRRRESSVRNRRVRRGRLDVRHHVREPAGGCGGRARARVPQGRTNRADDLGAGQQPVQDVPGDEALHAAAAEPGAAFAVRVGPHRAHPAIARRHVPACGSRKASRTTASRAARRHGTRSRRATGPRDRWRRASIRRGAACSARTSSRSTTDSAPSSASACRANTG